MDVTQRRPGWNPWRALRDREHLVFAVSDLPAVVGGGVYWPRGARAAIILDRSLTAVARNAALAHELTHDDLPGATESQVNDEVARRLVPDDDLAAMFEIAVLNDLPVEPWQVAERFEVPDGVAERAMRLFLSRRG